MHNLCPIIVPRKNVNDDEVLIVKWLKSSGDCIGTGDEIVDIETTKTLFTISAECDGFLFYKIPEQSRVKVGITIAFICEDNIMPDVLTNAESHDDLTLESNPLQPSISLKAKKLMEKHGLSEQDFPDLKIVKVSDVETKISQMQHVLLNDIEEPVQTEIYEQAYAKQFEIRLLTASTEHTIPSCVSVLIDKNAVERKIASLIPQGSTHISVGEYFTFEAARVLKHFPVLNGYYRQGIARLYSNINIGFAINIEKGLKVPVIKQADEKSLTEISSLIRDFSLKYLRDELTVEDLQGGTFTITDLSLFDVTYFIPVINNMQSAILGICSPLPQNSYFNIVLTFDHQLADGMVAAKMLKELKDVVCDQ